MRNKYLENKKELENAFSFGHTKNKENNESPKRKTAPNLNAQLPEKIRDLSYLDRFIKTSYIAKTPEHQRNIKNSVQFNLNTSKQDELLRKFDQYDKRFSFGKAIKSQTVEEPVQTLIFPQRQEFNPKLTTQLNPPQKKIFSNYNPSIQDIKKKYGYTAQNHHPTIHKQPSQTYNRLKQLQQDNKKHYEITKRLYINDYSRNQQKTYQKGSQLLDNLSYFQNSKRTPLAQRDQPHQNGFSKYSASYQHKPYTRGISNFSHQQMIRNRTKTYDRMPSENVPQEKSFERARHSNNKNIKNQEDRKDWMLKSINELDTKISQKINRLVPENIITFSFHRQN